jgi:aminoglycoside 6-adenylyltransferase
MSLYVKSSVINLSDNPFLKGPFMDQATMLQRFIDWGQAREDVRVLILTSTRTVPGAVIDVFSDYDIILASTQAMQYQADGWLTNFEPLLVLYRDPVRLIHDEPTFARITQYADGLKIDFTIWTVELLRRYVAEAARTGVLEPDMDLGYRVLMDKDRLTAGLPAPTHQAYIPARPDEAEYRRVVEEFFHEGTYVVKYIWRGDIMAVKHLFDEEMKGQSLLPMLEWYMQIGHDWKVRAGAYGRQIQRKLPPEIVAELAATYTGAGTEENWLAFYRTIGLFEKVARAVGEHLGYVYPEEMHGRCMAYFRRVQSMAAGASDMPKMEDLKTRTFPDRM